tara:strand:+ start:71 stop:1135 length:1065 start_codon:yes stop_codon:yes gene_type:complete
MRLNAGIQAFCGTRGSGKTIHVVERIVEALVQGRVVVSNVQLLPGAQDYAMSEHGRRYKEELYRFIPLSDMEEFYEKVPRGTGEFPVLVVFDEILEWFDSQKGPVKDRVDSVFRNSRKLNLEFILIIQTFAHMQKRLRDRVDLIEHHYDYRKLRVPMIGFSLCPVHIVRIIRTGRINGVSCYINTRRWMPNKAIYGAYDTNQEFLASGLSAEDISHLVGNQEVEEEMGRNWKVNAVFNSLLVCLLCVVMWRGRGDDEKGADDVANSEGIASGVVPGAVGAVAVEVVEPVVETVRLTGIVKGGGVVYAVVSGGMYRVGDMGPLGIVASISDDRVIFQDGATIYAVDANGQRELRM